MISMNDYETMSYRQLQAVAKNTKVPANLKKSYLVKLLIARSKGDESLVLNIVQEAHCERAHKGRQNLRSNLFLHKESPSERNIHHPNTELEKLLKAPFYSRLENSGLNYNTRSTRCNEMSNGRNSRFYHTNQIATVSSTTHKIGKKSKINMALTRKFEIHNLDSDTDTQYDSDVSNHMKSDNLKSMLKTSFDPHMGMADSINHTPHSSTSSEYLDVDNWTSYDGSTNSESGIIGPSSDNINNAENIGINNDVARNSTNDFKLDEYNGCFGREQVYSHTKKQKIASSEISSFNMHDYYQNPYEARYKKENYIVINQHFKFYGSMMPEQNRNVIQEIHNYDTVAKKRLPSFDTFDNSRKEFYANNNKYTAMKNYTRENQIDNQTHEKKPKPVLLLPDRQNSKNNILGAKGVYGNPTSVVLNNGTNLIHKIIKKRVGKVSHNTIADKYIADISSLDINKTTESYNNAVIEIPDEPDSTRNHIRNSMPEIIPNDFLNEFLSLDLRCDVNEDISMTVQDYFDNLDFRTTAKNRPASDNEPVNSKEEAYTSQRNEISSQLKHQFDIPYIPINGVPTSMLCFICNWMGKISEFDSHVRTMHSNNIFVTNDGMLTIAVNMGLMSKKAKNHHKQCFIVHEGNLFIAHFKYKYPDIIQPIILSIPPNGQTVVENTLLASAKFYMQIINCIKQQEMLWCGTIECINNPGRPLDIDVFSNRKHGKFEVSMRSLDLVPENIPLKELSDHLEGCIFEIHFFLEVSADI